MGKMTTSEVGSHVQRHLAEMADLFVPGVKLTFLMRNPDAPDGSMLITDEDDLYEIERAIARLQGDI